MAYRQKLPKSLRIYIRLEKARIRKATQDPKEQERLIQELQRRSGVKQ